MQPEDVLRLNAINQKGQAVPLSAFATTRWVVGPMQTVRYNGYPAMRISGSAAPGVSTGQAMAEMEALAAKLPAGIGYEWTGISRENSVQIENSIAALNTSIHMKSGLGTPIATPFGIPFSS